MLTISQFKTKVTGKLHGTTLNKINDVNNKIGEAAGNVLLRTDPSSTIRRQIIESAIYDKIYNYTAPTDLKGINNIIDIRPIGERSNRDDINGRFSREFDIKKERNTLAVEYVNGVKTLRLSKQLTTPTTLFRADSLTLEGSVTAGGDASNLSIDTLDHISGSGALKFDLSGSTGTATITIALTTPLDLSDMEDVGALFEWFKFPDSARLNSLTLKWGSSGSVYWSDGATAAHDRAFESNAWQLIRHDWNVATETGSPTATDAAAIDYIQLTINYDTGAALTGVKLDNFTAAKGEVWEVLYYSNRLFTDTTGVTWKENPTVDTDIIMLDPDGVNILLYEFMTIVSQEVKGKNMGADLTSFERKLEGGGNKPGLYDLYNQRYPSLALPFQASYYDFGDIGPNTGFIDEDDN